MDIQNTDYKEIAKIIYPHYFMSEIERRAKALACLKYGDFKQLRNISHYCIARTQATGLKSTNISCVIEELQKFKRPDNSDEPRLISYTPFDSEDDESVIVIEYTVFSVVGEEKCKSLAKHWSESAAWKLKHQPNGKDGKAAMKILQQYIYQQ